MEAKCLKRLPLISNSIDLYIKSNIPAASVSLQAAQASPPPVDTNGVNPDER